MTARVSRRRFIQGTAAAGFWISGRQAGFGQEKSPNAKLNVACVGVGGRGRASVDGCRGENIVELRDVDRRCLNRMMGMIARPTGLARCPARNRDIRPV